MTVDFQDAVVMAPLTKGGNLPFRRLCLSLGATITMSEMAYARQVKRGSKSEMALLRKHPDEACYGVQLAANQPDETVVAAQKAVERGAAWVDINAGCPIYDTVKRGLGAQLLQKPGRLARVVEALVAALEVPVTVKLRTGWSESKINAPEVARVCEEAGAAAIALHGRTKEQRYTRSADWGMVRQLVAERGVPILGNGDILTWYEAADRKAESGCHGVMLARGCLIKPWLFREVAEGADWLPSAEERVGLLLRFVGYLREHFGDDEIGRKRAMRFLPWHLQWFARYRPYPADAFREQSKEHPLIQTRIEEDRGGGDLPVLEQMLRDPREEMHQALADLLWDTADGVAAVGGGGADAAALESEGLAPTLAAMAQLAETLPPQMGESAEMRTAQG